MSKLIPWVISVVLIIGLIIVGSLLVNMTADRDRQETNMANITQDNKDLTLKADEFKRLSGEDKETLDSVLKANKKNPKLVTQATLIKAKYSDSDKVPAVIGAPVVLPQNDSIPTIKPLLSISADYDSKCWSMKGEIITTDPNAKFNILNRYANIDAQLIKTRAKYFLGFLWRTQKEEYNAYSDCGVINFTDIKIIK